MCRSRHRVLDHGPRHKVIRTAIESIDETAWVHIAYTEGGAAQLAETTWDRWRLIVRRSRIEDPTAAQLFPDRRHYALVSNGDGDPVELDIDHRANAVVELAIRVLKHGAGLTHCPSGRFRPTPPGWSPPCWPTSSCAGSSCSASPHRGWL
jgi:hypothetical protein